jgi:hypothetical protein
LILKFLLTFWYELRGALNMYFRDEKLQGWIIQGSRQEHSVGVQFFYYTVTVITGEFSAKETWNVGLANLFSKIN